jgi:hypothetical protein
MEARDRDAMEEVLAPDDAGGRGLSFETSSSLHFRLQGMFAGGVQSISANGVIGDPLKGRAAAAEVRELRLGRLRFDDHIGTVLVLEPIEHT